jgi:hypothetical protein
VRVRAGAVVRRNRTDGIATNVFLGDHIVVLLLLLMLMLLLLLGIRLDYCGVETNNRGSSMSEPMSSLLLPVASVPSVVAIQSVLFCSFRLIQKNEDPPYFVFCDRFARNLYICQLQIATSTLFSQQRTR